MTVTADTGAGTSTTSRTWRQRHGATVLVGGVFLLAVTVSILVGRGSEGRTERLDPGNAGPQGAQALAQVLDDEGVDVSIIRSADELDDATLSRATTVLVTSTDDLGRATIDRLLERSRGSRLVVVDSGPAVVKALGSSAQVSTVDPDAGIKARCDDPQLAGLTLMVDAAVVYDGGAGCFVQKGGGVVVQERAAFTLFGGGEAMTNDQILRGDNAAIILRLAGQFERLVWYVPSRADVAVDDGLGVGSLLPRWIRPGLWMIAVAGVFLIVWRARRLGPLSSEPLPSVVEAIETTQSRGRLYRKSKDRTHAAAVLRGAARRKAAHRLGLGDAPDQDAVVQAVARRAGRPTTDVAALLGVAAEAPATDSELITLARDLNALDTEVRNP